MLRKGSFRQLVRKARHMYLESKTYFRAADEEDGFGGKSGQGFLDMSGGVCVICREDTSKLDFFRLIFQTTIFHGADTLAS